MSFRCHIGLIVCLLAAIPGYTQTESTLYFMTSLPQVVEANPAIMPRYKTSIGLPGISSFGGVYANNGFALGDYISNVDGVSKLDLSGWTKGLAEKNYVNLSAYADVFRVGLRINPKWYLTMSSTVKQYNSTMIPKGLATLLVDGTASIIDSYSNTSPQQEFLAYMQTSVGAAYKINDHFTVGGRLKYINGLANVTTENSSLIVQVDNNYQITVTGDALVKTSGISEARADSYNLANNLGNNFGWGLDIGASYKFMDKLIISASINDIGAISWKNNTRQYALDPTKAQYKFSGFDVNQLLDDNSDYLHQQLDSISSKFEMVEGTTGSYTTSLPTKFYLAGTYELMPNFSVGTLFFGESFRDRFSTGLTASVNKTFGRVVSTSLTYTVSNRAYNNIGLGVSFNLSPVQIYVVGDNLLMAPASMIAGDSFSDYINSSQLLTLRAGINIVFGWDKGLFKGDDVNDDSHNPKQKGPKTKTKNTFGRSPQKKSKVGR
ncbi:MAG: hypothetical protein JNK10_13970 [Cyclobacteriaceae bacterium]|nr:hypothetical protein [Cyclobacteriaceae bacterium]